MVKFPKTPRVGAEMWDKIPLTTPIHVEEKLDGANVGVSSQDSQLVLQSRGHILRGGAREKLFERFKSWAYARESVLLEATADGSVLFLEYLAVKHRVFYDALPDTCVLLDVFRGGAFLSLEQRKAKAQLAAVPEPPLVWSGLYSKLPDFKALTGPSHCKSKAWREVYIRQAAKAGVRDDVWNGTENSDLMEGVYLRLGNGLRFKLPRPEFEKVRDADSSWDDRKYIFNTIGSP